MDPLTTGPTILKQCRELFDIRRWVSVLPRIPVRHLLLAVASLLPLFVQGSEGWAGAIARGDGLASEYRFLSAAGQYRQAALWPGAASIANLRLGGVLLRRGEWADALEAFRSVGPEAASSREAMLGLADAQYRVGDVAASVETLRHELDLRPRDSQAWRRLVDQGARLGRTPAEIRARLAGIPGALTPVGVEQYDLYLLGACVLGADTEEGVSALRSAALARDASVAALARELLDAAAGSDANATAGALAGAFLAQGLLGPALASAERVHGDGLPAAEALALKGYALLRLGRLAEADAAIARSLVMAPDQPLGQYILASLSAARGDAEGAVRLLRQASQRQPDSPAIYLDMASALAGLGDYTDAGWALGRAVEVAPDSADIRLAVARFRVDRQYQVEAALDDASEAVRLSNRSVDALSTLGWALQLSGRPDEARPLLEEAVGKNPGGALLRYRLGSAYEQLGDVAHAKEQFGMVVELDGSGELRRRAAEALEGL